MERPEEAVWIADRREAIRFTGRSVASRDVVLVAGKGHEPYQIIGSNRVHFDDREEVMRWFG
jgi:UDP-N-acetylmuramoyl-L-alanyl-D-glutamate--2,6-diaminopimelate ligase